MKQTLALTLALSALAVLPGCASTGESDQERAFRECRDMPSAARRDLCISEELARQAAERAQREAQFNAERADAERRAAELEALGVPESEIGRGS